MSNVHSVLPLSQENRWFNMEKIHTSGPTKYDRTAQQLDGWGWLSRPNYSHIPHLHQNQEMVVACLFVSFSAFVNIAWLLYRLLPSYTSEKLDFLEFTRRIVNCFLQRQIAKLSGPSQVLGRVLSEVRFDGVQYMHGWRDSNATLLWGMWKKGAEARYEVQRSAVSGMFR